MYTVFVNETQFRRGDRPVITGKLYDANGKVIGASELAFATIRYVNQGWQYLFSESKVDLSSLDFIFTFPEPVIDRQFGNIYLRVYPAVFGNFELLNPVVNNQTLIDIDIKSGSIPGEGFARIDNEVVEFIKVTNTRISVIRGKFNTDIPANYPAGNKITFAKGYETCMNRHEICIEKDY